MPAASRVNAYLTMAFSFYDTLHLYKKNDSLATIHLWKGTQNELKAGFDRDVYFTLPKGQADKLKATMEYKQPLIAPIRMGRKSERLIYARRQGRRNLSPGFIGKC